MNTPVTNDVIDLAEFFDTKGHDLPTFIGIYRA
jgi:hypothetical protein